MLARTAVYAPRVYVRVRNRETIRIVYRTVRDVVGIFIPRFSTLKYRRRMILLLLFFFFLPNPAVD